MKDFGLIPDYVSFPGPLKTYCLPSSFLWLVWQDTSMGTITDFMYVKGNHMEEGRIHLASIHRAHLEPGMEVVGQPNQLSDSSP